MNSLYGFWRGPSGHPRGTMSVASIYMIVIIQFPTFLPFWDSPVKFTIEFKYSTIFPRPLFKRSMQEDICPLG